MKIARESIDIRPQRIWIFKNRKTQEQLRISDVDTVRIRVYDDAEVDGTIREMTETEIRISDEYGKTEDITWDMIDEIGIALSGNAEDTTSEGGWDIRIRCCPGVYYKDGVFFIRDRRSGI